MFLVLDQFGSASGVCDMVGFPGIAMLLGQLRLVWVEAASA
jgi:hypothetical protein